MQERHNQKLEKLTDEVIVVSPQQGIYLVPRNIQGPGNKHPIHVQHSGSGRQPKIFCETEKCSDMFLAYKRGNVSTFSCEHSASAALNKQVIPPNSVS